MADPYINALSGMRGRLLATLANLAMAHKVAPLPRCGAGPALMRTLHALYAAADPAGFQNLRHMKGS